MLGVTLARSKTLSGLPKSRKRKGVVSTGAKREGIGPGAARRKIRMTTCTSKKMPTVPTTIRFGQRNGLVLDANIDVVVSPNRTLPYEIDTTATLGGCWRSVLKVEEGTSSVVFRELSTREVPRIIPSTHFSE